MVEKSLLITDAKLSPRRVLAPPPPQHALSVIVTLAGLRVTVKFHESLTVTENKFTKCTQLRHKPTILRAQAGTFTQQQT